MLWWKIIPCSVSRFPNLDRRMQWRARWYAAKCAKDSSVSTFVHTAKCVRLTACSYGWRINILANRCDCTPLQITFFRSDFHLNRWAQGMQSNRHAIDSEMLCLTLSRLPWFSLFTLCRHGWFLPAFDSGDSCYISLFANLIHCSVMNLLALLKNSWAVHDHGPIAMNPNHQ